VESSFAIRHRASRERPDHTARLHHEGNEQRSAIGSSSITQVATVTATEDEGAAEEGFLHFLRRDSMLADMDDIPARVVLVVPSEALDPDHVTGLT
jgi:hypothetical protein